MIERWNLLLQFVMQNHEQSLLHEDDIDFILGFPHSVVKLADNYPVRELVRKIENHPHRQSRQQDLQQNKVYNPFSTTSKKKIRDMGNVELFGLFETDPKTQFNECFSYWMEGIVHCTCGQIMIESAANRSVIQKTSDFLSIPNYVIKKVRLHGRSFGKAPEQKAIIIWSIIWRTDASRSILEGIDDRFLWDIATFCCDSNEALCTLNRLHRDSGERQFRPIPFRKYQHWHQSSSSSTSWWQWSGSW